MEDFALDFGKKKEDESGEEAKGARSAGSDELQMSVSAICEKEGRRFAYVTFSGGGRKAEGEIPSCVIRSCEGFSSEEVKQLEAYMKKNLDMLKTMAAGINPLKAFMK